MQLHEIRTIDLSKSVIDPKMSDPDKGKYVFLKKVYTTGQNSSDHYHFGWCRYEPRNGYRELREWEVKFGYTPVTNKVDPYYPEGMTPNAEGHYVYGDLIRVKCPLISHLEAMEANEKLSRGAAKGKIDAFKNQMRREGGAIPDSMIDDMIQK